MPIGVGDTRTIGSGLTVGVLALQGAFEIHQQRLRQLGADAPLVKTCRDLDGLDGIVLPGGESTILCATETLDGRADQRGFDLIDITVRRNGCGRQLDSFETELDVSGLDAPFRAVFIRAPLVERIGQDVEVLARHDGVPVMARSGRCTVASFHPELTDDVRLHALFLDSLDTSS